MPRQARPVAYCEVATRVPHRAWVEVLISGTLHEQGPPVKACRGHVQVPIDNYLLISNDVKVRLIK